MFERNKTKILEYLNSQEEVAIAPGYVFDVKTSSYTDIELVSYSDGKSEWTSEDIYNYEKNNIIFNKQLFDEIIKN